MSTNFGSFSTSCYLPKNSFNNSCQLTTSPSRVTKYIQPQLQCTQINIVSLYRHLNRLRPRIAVLEMMKEKVQAASLVQKGLIQKRITSDFEKSLIRRRREKSVHVSRDIEKKQIEKRKQYYQYESARMSQQFRKSKQMFRDKIINNDKKIWQSNKEMYDRGRNEHKIQKQRVIRCNLFKERRAKSFHEDKLKRLESENLKKLEKIERLSELCRRTEVKSPFGKRDGMRPIEKIVLEIQEGLSQMKEFKIKVEK